MPLIIGLVLIPIIIFIIIKSNSITTKKRDKIILNILLILISILYIILCLIIRVEPFNFEDHYSTEYMFYNGEYIVYSGIIFMFTPFMWIVLFHFLKMIFYSIRVRKNAMIKKDEEYIYYRGDLDKVSPSIIMFTSTFEVDIKKSVSATILKLKQTGYIEENNGTYIYTNKDESNLLESEKMILNLIRYNEFDTSMYKKVIEKETLENKYITRNHGGKISRIIKIIIAIFVPILVFCFSLWLDDYHFQNYHVYPENDGHAYIYLEKEKDIEQLYKEVKDENDYKHDGYISYDYSKIRADKLEYGVVRKAFFLSIIVSFSLGFILVFVLIGLYVIIEQIIHFNKNYTRTIKGKILLNKAYALKNYLSKYSLIKNRTEKELILWEYYLIYAVVLNVNVKIKDEIIEKYVSEI